MKDESELFEYMFSSLDETPDVSLPISACRTHYNMALINSKMSNSPNVYIEGWRGRNKPKLPLVCRISDMLQTTCPPTCPLVQVLFHFVGPNWMLSTIKIADNLREDMGLTALLLFLV